MAFPSKSRSVFPAELTTGNIRHFEVILSSFELANLTDPGAASDLWLETYGREGGSGSAAKALERFRLSDFVPTAVAMPERDCHILNMEVGSLCLDDAPRPEAVALIDLARTEQVVSFQNFGPCHDLVASDGFAVGARASNLALLDGQYSVRLPLGGTPSGADKPVRSSAGCLCVGAMVQTPEGPRLIETLQVGDLVTTRDNGPRPVRHILLRRLAPLTLKERPHLLPVMIRAGSLVVGLPKRDLTVSPGNRILMADPRLGVQVGQPARHAPARSLVGVLPGVTMKGAARSITYIHLDFGQPEVIFAEGLQIECYALGAKAWQSLPVGAKADLQEIFPGQLDDHGQVVTGRVRPGPRKRVGGGYPLPGPFQEMPMRRLFSHRVGTFAGDKPLWPVNDNRRPYSKEGSAFVGPPASSMAPVQ